jgi:hypothetical protein
MHHGACFHGLLTTRTSGCLALSLGHCTSPLACREKVKCCSVSVIPLNDRVMSLKMEGMMCMSMIGTAVQRRCDAAVVHDRHPKHNTPLVARGVNPEIAN